MGKKLHALGLFAFNNPWKIIGSPIYFLFSTIFIVARLVWDVLLVYDSADRGRISQ